MKYKDISSKQLQFLNRSFRKEMEIVQGRRPGRLEEDATVDVQQPDLPRCLEDTAKIKRKKTLKCSLVLTFNSASPTSHLQR